jgi:NAD(P)-dependent dehydrogenase (short-subunit alcohol dehydrogenase family)
MTDVTADSVHDDSVRDLAGRAALVTGASRGIGFAIARELLARGASVTITARKPDELAAAAEQLAEGADPSRVLAVAGNAGSPEAREEAVGRTVETFGTLRSWSTTRASTRPTAP